MISGLDCEVCCSEVLANCRRSLNAQETLIPVGEDIIGINVEEELRWVLVVEKEVSIEPLTTDKSFTDTRYFQGSVSDTLPTQVYGPVPGYNRIRHYSNSKDFKCARPSVPHLQLLDRARDILTWRPASWCHRFPRSCRVGKRKIGF